MTGPEPEPIADRPAERISVLIADDHPLFRAALTETLAASGELEVVATASDGQEALDLIKAHCPQVAVLDVRMPKLDGREVVRRVRQAELPTRHRHRELGVLELIAEGESAVVIAERLHLAVPTVKTHLQNLYAKLGVNDRGAAVAEAMRRGLLT